MPTRRLNGQTYDEVLVVAHPEQPIGVIQGLSVPQHDYVELSYTGSDLTGVTYKFGGTWSAGVYSGGSVVAQLELVYSNGNLTKVAVL